MARLVLRLHSSKSCRSRRYVTAAGPLNPKMKGAPMDR